MIGVDTNILVRVLVDDQGQPRQTAAARGLLLQHSLVFVASATLIETAWVMRRAYRLGRKELGDVLQAVLQHPRLKVEQKDLFLEALAVFRESVVEYADAVTLTRNRAEGAELHTFDRKLAKLDGAKLLSDRPRQP